MITFIVEKDDVSKTIQFSTDGTLLDLKKEIINQYDLDCKYIDVISTIERPIRALGMFNFDIGLQPRTLDNYPFNRYNLDGRTITLTYEINDEYKPFVKKANTNSGETSKYVPPNGQSLREGIDEDSVFDINSDLDFPSL
jgi:hypothetical protein